MENIGKKQAVEFSALKSRCAELERRVNGIENVISLAKEYLTLEEAAAFLGCTRSLLYKMTHENRLPYFKPSGKLVYFEKEELIKWIRRNKSLSEEEISDEAKKVIQKLARKE